MEPARSSGQVISVQPKRLEKQKERSGQRARAKRGRGQCPGVKFPPPHDVDGPGLHCAKIRRQFLPHPPRKSTKQKSAL